MATNFKVTEDLLASNGQRLLHNIIDYVIIYTIILSIPALAAFFVIPPSQQGKIFPQTPLPDQLRQIVIFMTGLLLYANVMEIFFSRTIAKFITGTIVVLEDGSRPDANAILIRSLCRLIPFDNFSFLFRPRRGWHDSLSNTYVVNNAALENAKRAFYNDDNASETD
ncbi:MAG TPA: RDD family protein [Flavobacterium sp.]|nr:RDD family protein [Flavobacterium sp.]